MKIAFIGLGVMGFPMAGHLLNAGHTITVFNRSREKAERWLATYPGGALSDSPATAAQGADIILTCVGNDDDLRAVILGPDGIAATAKSGCVLVDHTTASADIARELFATLREKKIGFVDAPVSGGQAGAVNGQLTIMCGGNDADFAQVQDVIAVYARQVTLMGPAGSGQLTKMVNQICIAGLIQSLAEGVQFALNAGLDAEKVFDVIASVGAR